MVLENEFPHDNRVEKEAISLAEMGHEIHLACYAKKSEFIKTESYKGFSIHRIRISSLMFKLSAAILVLPFYFRFWYNFIEELEQTYHFDAVHVHDLPLAKAGYKLAKKHGLRLILDQHEFYSNWIVHTAHYNTLLGKFIKAFSNWKKYENRYLNKADLVITVEPPLRKIYLEEYHLQENRIICIPNVPKRTVFTPDNVSKEIVKRYSGQFILLYIGGIDILRGLETAYAAMPEIKRHIPHAKLMLIGKVIKPMDPYALAEKFGIRDDFIYHKHQPIEMIPSYIFSASVCFFTPSLNREEVHNTIATKIYQYIAMGKPVIVSKARMMADFVIENGLGYVIEENDHKAFAEGVLQLFSKPSVRQQIETNALQISQQYFWEEKVKPLLQFYDDLSERRDSD